MKSDLAEDVTQFSNQDLVTASLNRVVSKQLDAVFAVGEEIIGIPGVGVGRGGDDPLCRA